MYINDIDRQVGYTIIVRKTNQGLRWDNETYACIPTAL